MTHLKSILLLLFSAAALFAASIFFLFEESRDYYRELEVETSASADTRVCLTDAGDGACYLMLPKAEGGEARFVLDGAYSASIDGAGIRSGGSAGALKEGVHTLTIRKRGNPFACRISFTLFREAALPWLYLDFPSGSLYKISQEKGRQETAMLIAMTSDQTEDFADSCKVKVHGNTSWFNDKKSLALNFDDGVSFFGMSAQKKWLLISNYADLSSLKNAAAYQTQKALGVPYAPDCCFVNVCVNGTYEGLYLLIQKIDGSGGTVTLPDLEEENRAVNRDAADHPDAAPSFLEEEGGLLEKGLDLHHTPADISGGYLLELCGRLSFEGRGAGFTTPHRFVVIRTPNNASRGEVHAIASFVREAEASLYGEGSTSRLWTSYFDQTSWIQQDLLQEFFLNNDTELNSEYFWTAGDGDLLHAGPGWDFDLSFASLTGDSTWDLQSLHVEGLKEDGNTVSGLLWLPQMNRDQRFHRALASYFVKTMAPVLREEIEEDLPKTARSISRAAQMDSAIWHGGSDPAEAADDLLEEMRARLSFLTDYFSSEAAYAKLRFQAPSGRFDLVLALRKGTVLAALPTAAGCGRWKTEDGLPVTAPITVEGDLTFYPDEEAEPDG